MKKILTLAAAFAICANVSAQSSGWRIGATIGSFGNQSQFSGGNSNASALFMHEKYGAGMIGVLFRKQLTNHWSIRTGLNFSSLGFQYSMARDYNLMQPKTHLMMNQVSAGTTTIPVTIIYNFNPNCKNVRWFVGAGVSLVGGGSVYKSNDSHASQSEAAKLGMTTAADMTQTVSSSSFLTLNGHFTFGVEKIYKRGTMLSLAAYFNGGFTPLATSTVTYSVNGQAYSHSFTNYNNYAGLTLSYYFKPLNCKAKTSSSSAARVIKS